MAFAMFTKAIFSPQKVLQIFFLVWINLPGRLEKSGKGSSASSERQDFKKYFIKLK
jgi:hypothetical protein